MKLSKVKNKFTFTLAFSAFCFQTFVVEISAQIKQVTPAAPKSEDDYTWWYIMLFVLVGGLVGAIVWLRKNKQTEKKELDKLQKSSTEDYWDTQSVDADKELEWLRQNNLVIDKKQAKRKTKKLPKVQSNEAVNETDSHEIVIPELVLNTPLPVFGFTQLLPSKLFAPLAISNNESLMSAIEQAQDEEEEDEEVRDLAVRVLAAFKFRNSIEALTQVAIYDLSSSLRSKAVSILADFDHESVFEGILQAGADPTREVRAAAARGLSRINIDRADAWTRIAETNEEGRMRQAARAAMEGGVVQRSFERLVHRDQKYAYEAFALLALLIKAGETGPIFEALKNHPDENVKLALLHLIKVIKSQNALDGLYALLEDKDFSAELKDNVSQTIEAIGFVTV